jgi:TPR repeat protein
MNGVSNSAINTVMQKVTRVFIAALVLQYSLISNATIEQARNAIVDKNYQEAESLLTPLTVLGNAEAQFELGILAYKGYIDNGDKINAFSWLFLASEADFPNASVFAQKVFSELSTSDQELALNTAATLSKGIGKQRLKADIFPEIVQTPIQAQVIDKQASESYRFQLEPDDIQLIDRRAEANNKRVAQQAQLISRLNRGYRHNAFDNLKKIELEDEPGFVIVKHNVNQLGQAVDPEVIFSAPDDRFDELIIESILKSKYTPATRHGEAVEQFGVISTRRIGVSGKSIFHTEHPQRYKHFLRLRRQVTEGTDDVTMYRYATMLRAFGDLIVTDSPISYTDILKDLAEKGYVKAQYEYAEHLIFEKNDISQGTDWLLTLAQNGHVQAQYRLGELLLRPTSDTLVQSKEKAQFWLSLAAKQQHKKAINLLSNIS